MVHTGTPVLRAMLAGERPLSGARATHAGAMAAHTA
jgi:hypothetical protein